MDTFITTSWDDGHRLDMKLADLLDKYDVPATFYVPIDYPRKKSLTDEEIRQMAGRFDVGGHTYHHIRLNKVPIENAGIEIREGRKRLGDILGNEPLSFAYPYGDFNGSVTEMVKQAGYIGARNINLLTRRWGDPFRMSTTVNAVDLSPFRYTRDSLSSPDISFFSFVLKNNLLFKSWYEIAIRTLDFIVAHGGIWHLWGHSWEIDVHDAWGTLEEILKKINDLPAEVRRVDNSQLLQMHGSRL
jgi:peptidoglycan/xylan/chitin deacetylase (PgdA/CDA1 family)